MLRLAWLVNCLPSVLVVGLASAAALSASTWKQSVSAGGALSRHPSSAVYSDLPFRDPLPVVLASFAVHWLLFLVFPVPAAWLPAAAAAAAAPSTAAIAGPPSSTVVQRSYLVSLLHALCAVSSVALWLAVYDVDWRAVQRGMGGGRRGTGDEWQSVAVGWSMGYFVYDAACMLVHRPLYSRAGLLHHVAIGSAFVLGLYTDCCRPFHFLFLLEELSTPPLNLKTLLRHNRRLADVCAALFAVSFVAVRLGYGMIVYVLACMQLGPFVQRAVADGERMQAAAALFQFVLCTASRLLNLYWAALIARKLRRAIGGPTGITRLRLEADVGGSPTTHYAHDRVDLCHDRSFVRSSKPYLSNCTSNGPQPLGGSEQAGSHSPLHPQAAGGGDKLH